jgi:hypothetical protein
MINNDMKIYADFMRDKYLWNQPFKEFPVYDYLSKNNSEQTNKLIHSINDLSKNHNIINWNEKKCVWREDLFFIDKNNNLQLNINIFDKKISEYIKVTNNPPLYHSYIYMPIKKIGISEILSSPSFLLFNSKYSKLVLHNLNLIVFYHYDDSVSPVNVFGNSIQTTIMLFIPFKNEKLIPNFQPFINGDLLNKSITLI